MGSDVTEEWRPVPGFGGRFQVSSLGRVRRLRFTVHKSDGNKQTYPERLLTASPHAAGYRTVALCYESKTHTTLLHRLIAQAFIPNPDSLPFVRHLNDIPDDNRIENLAWGTQSDNMGDCVRNGNHNHARRDLCPRGHEYKQYATRRGCPTCASLLRDRKQRHDSMKD